MATLYVTEYTAMADAGSGHKIPIARHPAIKHQTVAIDVAHAESSTFQGETRFVRLHTDAICSIDIGSSPAATTSMCRLAANQTEYFGVAGAYKVSVIANS